MKIAVIDGQGGKIGQMLVSAIKKAEIPCTVRAVGTNSNATASNAGNTAKRKKAFRPFQWSGLRIFPI